MGRAGETATFIIRNGCFEVSAMCKVLAVSSLNFCTSQSHWYKSIYLLIKLCIIFLAESRLMLSPRGVVLVNCL